MSHLSEPTLASLASQFVDTVHPPNTDILTKGETTQAALYFVRAGKVEMKASNGETSYIDSGGYFGEDMLEIDIGGMKKTTDCVAKYTVRTLAEEVIVGLLTMEKCRQIVDTTMLGKREKATSVVESNISLEALKKHAILGAGTSVAELWATVFVLIACVGSHNFGIASKVRLVRSGLFHMCRLRERSGRML